MLQMKCFSWLYVYGMFMFVCVSAVHTSGHIGPINVTMWSGYLSGQWRRKSISDLCAR